MDTLSLVAPEYRGMAREIPVFDHDGQSIEEIRAVLASVYAGALGPSSAATYEERHVPGAAGDPDVRVLLFRPARQSAPVPAILHMHGGGFVAGSADVVAPSAAKLAHDHGVVVISVDYRLAPETPFPGPLDDCYSALAWLFASANELGIDPERVAVLGDSAGGGLAAALALLARDRGEYPVRAQFLIYPALDCRTGTPDAPVDNPTTGEFVWTRKNTRDIWVRLQGPTEIAPDALTYFSPALASDLSALPSTFLACGSLDLFLEEGMAYALRLSRAGVPIEAHVYDGAYHGFDLLPGPTTDRYRSDLKAAIDRLLDLR